MDFLNQLSNNTNPLIVSLSMGFMGGQTLSLITGKDSLSPFTMITSGGVTFITHGLLLSGGLQFIVDDLNYLKTSILAIPHLIISTITSTISGLMPSMPTIPEKQPSIFDGLFNLTQI